MLEVEYIIFVLFIDSPSWITRPTNKTVIEGSMATFHCNATGNPAPNIAWMKDGKTVATGNTLSFKSSRNQSGEYWCSAKNGLKTVNTSFNLDVQCKYELFYKLCIVKITASSPSVC